MENTTAKKSVAETNEKSNPNPEPNTRKSARVRTSSEVGTRVRASSQVGTRATYGANSRTNPRNGASRRGQTSRREQEEKMTVHEKLMLQCMAAGIIFAVVLMLNLFGNTFMKETNEKIKVAIGTQVELEVLQAYTSDANSYFLSLQNAVKTIFGYENDLQPQVQQTDKAEGESNISSDDNNFRIDEEILNQLNATEDTYADREKK